MQPSSPRPKKTVANLGCGPEGGGRLPALFSDWAELRVDIDTSVKPDIVGSLTDLSSIKNSSLDAVWAAHSLEHLYLHEVPVALREFWRVLDTDGFACIVVPDIQSIAMHIANDHMLEPLYQSSAGPVTAHDIIFGYGPAIAQGRTPMAHRCGFTPKVLLQCLRQAPFGEVTLRRKTGVLELIVIAWKSVSRQNDDREQMLAKLGL